MEQFQSSRAALVELHRREGSTRRALFELGQAEFWIGYAAHEQSLLESSRESYLRYLEISRVLLEADPQNPDYQMEMMYAHSNLGSWELDNENAEGAIVHLRMSLDLNQSLVDAHPEDEQLQHELANTYSWLGELESQLGNLDRRLQELHMRRFLPILERFF